MEALQATVPTRATIRELLAELVREEVQPQALSYEGAARYLGTSTRAVKRYVAEGVLPCVRLPGRLVRFRVQDLEKFLARYRVGRGG